MPSYRVEALIQHKAEDYEDYLEMFIEGLLMGGGLRCSAGPVVFRVYPNGERRGDGQFDTTDSPCLTSLPPELAPTEG